MNHHDIGRERFLLNPRLRLLDVSRRYKTRWLLNCKYKERWMPVTNMSLYMIVVDNKVLVSIFMVFMVVSRL